MAGDAGGEAEGAAPLVLFLCTGNFYRSRLAELLFEAGARRLGLPHRAASAGLAPSCASRNRGPISPYTLAALAARGIPAGSPRAPLDVTEAQLAAATLVIALKESEHGPLVEERFPRFAASVRYWLVDDIDVAAPEVAVPLIESLVEELLRELARRPGRERRDER
jgi:protein-tyrosine phosphatase